MVAEVLFTKPFGISLSRQKYLRFKIEIKEQVARLPGENVETSAIKNKLNDMQLTCYLYDSAFEGSRKCGWVFFS